MAERSLFSELTSDSNDLEVPFVRFFGLQGRWRKRESGAGVLDTYTQALRRDKRAAQNKVGSMIRPKTELYRRGTASFSEESAQLVERLWHPRQDSEPALPPRQRALAS